MPSSSVAAILNQIRDNRIVLPDLQRDFVWAEDQIRQLFDSLMRSYPFGSLLLWETRFLEVPYRDFIRDFRQSLRPVPTTKPAGRALLMVLDGQQRLQALLIGIWGSYEGKRLYFNITSGPDDTDSDAEETRGTYKFEFWHEDDQTNRPKRLVLVQEIVGWAVRHEDDEISRVIEAVGLNGEEERRAAHNLRNIRRYILQDEIILTQTIDAEVTRPEQARSINEILEIFVRVNSGGTRLTRSDLMFGLIKTKWRGARRAFDELAERVDPLQRLKIDKDFLIRGLLVVAGAPVEFEVETIERYWDDMHRHFENFSDALAAAIDFVRDPRVGILSANLLSPAATLYPIVYYLMQFRNGSVPDEDRGPMRTALYFLLFNGFLRGKSPGARARWLREKINENAGAGFPLDAILSVIKTRQRDNAIETSVSMLNWNPRLALNIAQPQVCRETLSWQARAEVDHIFPQSVYREKFGDELVDDIGNFAYLGKLENQRKSAEEPWEYFADVPDDELNRDYLVERSLLVADGFPEFVRVRRERILQTVRRSLGR